MTPTFIGISCGILTVSFIHILKQLDKKIIFGVILSGIGFLYVGFVWTDWQALIVNSLQAMVFIFLAYYGTKKSMNILAIGYFLHGCWDIGYSFIKENELIPPHYDLFCSSLDFTICAYILLFKRKFSAQRMNGI